MKKKDLCRKGGWWEGYVEREAQAGEGRVKGGWVGKRMGW